MVAVYVITRAKSKILPFFLALPSLFTLSLESTLIASTRISVNRSGLSSWDVAVRHFLEDDQHLQFCRSSASLTTLSLGPHNLYLFSSFDTSVSVHNAATLPLTQVWAIWCLSCHLLSQSFNKLVIICRIGWVHPPIHFIPIATTLKQPRIFY